MKKNKIKKLALIALAGVFFINTGCTDDLDINTNPLVAVEVDPSLLFPTFMLGVSQNRTVEMNGTNMHAQHWSSGGSADVFFNPERYAISPNTTNNIWVGLYTTALRNINQVKVLVDANNPEALNIKGQAFIYEAFTFLNLTQIYEDVSISQATQVDEFPNPIFDAQEEVLFGIIDKLDEGISLLSTETEIVTNGDLIYNGNRQNWIRFANSLKLKTLMIIANKNPGAVQAQIQEVANQPLILENSQNAYLPYSDIVGNENPLYRTILLFAGGTNLFFYGGSTLVDIMNENEDPRRATFFDTNANGDYVGQDQGVLTSAGISRVSLNILRPDLEDRYATASETYFYLAEAVLKGYIAGDAQAFYALGLQASLNSYDGQPGAISAADKAVYIALNGDISTLSQTDALQKLHEEQYVALFTRGLEAWTHWRRTKAPEFMLPQGAVLNDIIRRYPYPLSEITSNPNAPAQKPLEEPMWFEN